MQAKNSILTAFSGVSKLMPESIKALESIATLA
jgi:hypothetical protein